MKFIFLGSGGCTALPRPGCFCKVCKEARLKGEPYKRSSCSIFLEDINLLIDTPEDINYSLNREQIKNIDIIMYSHWDPDHTLGIRVIEQLRLHWFKYFNGEKCNNPIKVYALQDVLEDIYSIKNKFGSYLSYYEGLNLCESQPIAKVKFKDIYITLIPIITNITSTAFVFENKNKKIIYAPCDNKPLPKNNLLYDADIFILGGFITENGFNDGTILHKDNKIFDAMLTLKEISDIKKEYNCKKIILTHLEEDWGLSFDDYNKMNSNDITFAYDGLIIDTDNI